jgi:hypothetical protein
MKHLFTFLLVAISATSFAQGNLQFNQVLNFDYVLLSNGGTNGQLAGTLSVPTNKVWKITSASAADDDLNDGQRFIRVNNHVLYERRVNGHLSMNTPYWLSTGNHTVEIFGNAKIGSLSIIEFNIIP